MTYKYEKFLVELKELCNKHDVSLSTSMYDSIQVWDQDEYMSAICDMIDDCTEGSEEYKRLIG